MNNKEKIIKILQDIITPLSQQADGHFIQSRIFESQGYSVLAEKYAEHTKEERDFVNKFIDRILDLGGEVKNEAKKEMPICKDPVDWLRYDFQLSKDGLEWLANLIKEVENDITTYDLLKEYYKDEEEDMYWAEQQLELIEKIGLQNWLVKQI